MRGEARSRSRLEIRVEGGKKMPAINWTSRVPFPSLEAITQVLIPSYGCAFD
jgi:hypothetical protein